MATIEKRDTGEGITYRAKIRIKGHPAQSATFARLTDARRWAQSTDAAIRERRYFKTKESQRRTLADLLRFRPRQREGAYTRSDGVRKIPPSTIWYKNTSRLAQVEAETGAGLPEFVREEFMEHTRN
jgi:hypothetical protein